MFKKFWPIFLSCNQRRRWHPPNPLYGGRGAGSDPPKNSFHLVAPLLVADGRQKVAENGHSFSGATIPAKWQRGGRSSKDLPKFTY